MTIITTMSCQAILQSGKREGSLCGRENCHIKSHVAEMLDKLKQKPVDNFFVLNEEIQFDKDDTTQRENFLSQFLIRDVVSIIIPYILELSEKKKETGNIVYTKPNGI